MGPNDIPKMKDDYACFSCFNCQIACKVGAIRIVESYHADGGFFDIQYPPVKSPIQPKDAEGRSDNWNVVEKCILERRSVRNFKPDPVPESLIKRVLEAGRFAPSAGNHQPWKFTVVTDKEFIDQMEEACYAVWKGLYPMFNDDLAVMNLVDVVPSGAFDPRVQGGVRCVANKELPIFLNAPVAIIIGCAVNMAAPEEQAGICGQNMVLAAKSLGLGSCWTNFAATVERIPEIKFKLGYGENWCIYSVICIGYPEFEQHGMVPRQARPITWFRPGGGGPQVEENE
jgi:nitroreductase